ncbi:MAG: biotin/lipoyl-containing protein, partial [Ginsengibacter sp.]
MPIEIKVPSVGESINEVTLTKWIKNDGDWVDRDEVIAELESEKATFEINAEKAGILHTNAKENDTLHIGDVAGTIDDAAEKPASVKKDPVSAKSDSKKEEKKSASTE